MKTVFLILLLLTIHLDSFSQTENQATAFIEGRIVSGVNNKPLANVPVYLKHSTIGTITDSLGYFKIKDVPQGNYHLIAREFGYAETEKAISVRSEPIKDLDITLAADCRYDRTAAKGDIASGKPKLLLVGSIAPVVYKNQHVFERKYKVEYFDFGCTPPAYECIKEYNKAIFSYLDKKYGDKWRKEVRPDVMFLKVEK
ncbi:carboxypeptidase-like regulatory domain-containing protein [uncultured Pontibacter sp.]|uniref:carboxypeptidase-like regulatory domain-containing protein n=1 Tax=uncultured Pontibacter sp. TaxID=453356 RepID=UPI002629D187|nr:carboxypeptidase-like regulatory domain-containing protein [uncultured Pontibacter sp.]